MQNYRLRLLREKLALKPIAEAAHDTAKREVEAARRHLKLRVDLERQAHETEDERKKAGCDALLKITPPLEELKENLELARLKLSSTVRLIRQFQDTEVRHQAETALTSLVESEYGDALVAIREKFGDIEVVYKLDDNRKQLDIYFGGQDFPVGDGHAHWVYRRNRYVYQRDPKNEQVAC